MDRISDDGDGDFSLEGYFFLETMRHVVAVIRLLEGICGEGNLEYPAARYIFEPLDGDHYFL